MNRRALLTGIVTLPATLVAAAKAPAPERTVVTHSPPQSEQHITLSLDGRKIAEGIVPYLSDVIRRGYY